MKKNNNNLQNIYTCYDDTAKTYKGIFYHNTDEDMIRTSLPVILNDVPLRDISIYKIGQFDFTTGAITSCPKKLVNTDKYLFPHSRLSSKGDDIELTELDKAIKQAKDKLKELEAITQVIGITQQAINSSVAGKNTN